MSHAVATIPCLPAMSEQAVAKVRELERAVLEVPQTPLVTRHLLHADMYSRTICIRAGDVLTGALIKIATTLIVYGRVTVCLGDEVIDLDGYNVLPGSVGRKQAFLAHSDVYLTMMFPSDAKTIEAAEAQFTDEAARLMSRHNENIIEITGE